jgi:hypothetical protein
MKILRCEKVPIYLMLTVQYQTVDTMTSEFDMIIKHTKTMKEQKQQQRRHKSIKIILPL